MKRQVRLGLLAALLGAGMLMAGASPATAGVPDVELKLAKEKSGPYSDTLRRNVGSNEKKNVFLRAKNKNNEMDSVNLFSPTR
jgi:hypothetical protein